MVGLETEKCSCGGYILYQTYWLYGQMYSKRKCMNINCPYAVKHEYDLDNQYKTT